MTPARPKLTFFVELETPPLEELFGRPEVLPFLAKITHQRRLRPVAEVEQHRPAFVDAMGQLQRHHHLADAGRPEQSDTEREPPGSLSYWPGDTAATPRQGHEPRRTLLTSLHFRPIM